jgi:hypothetical protein
MLVLVVVVSTVLVLTIVVLMVVVVVVVVVWVVRTEAAQPLQTLSNTTLCTAPPNLSPT